MEHGRNPSISGIECAGLAPGRKKFAASAILGLILGAGVGAVEVSESRPSDTHDVIDLDDAPSTRDGSMPQDPILEPKYRFSQVA